MFSPEKTKALDPMFKHFARRAYENYYQILRTAYKHGSYDSVLNVTLILREKQYKEGKLPHIKNALTSAFRSIMFAQIRSL